MCFSRQIPTISQGHSNIIKYCNRPFMSSVELQALRQAGENTRSVKISPATVQIHDETIIGNINKVVPAGATLFHLGDVAWVRTHEEMQRFLDRINCKNIILVRGNHDSDGVCSAFREVHSLLEIEIEHQKITMCHFSMRSWNCSHHGAIQLYGHHHSVKGVDLCPELMNMDVGVDGHDFMPWSFDEIMERMKQKQEVLMK